MVNIFNTYSKEIIVDVTSSTKLLTLSEVASRILERYGISN